MHNKVEKPLDEVFPDSLATDERQILRELCNVSKGCQTAIGWSFVNRSLPLENATLKGL